MEIPDVPYYNIAHTRPPEYENTKPLAAQNNQNYANNTSKLEQFSNNNVSIEPPVQYIEVSVGNSASCHPARVNSPTPSAQMQTEYACIDYKKTQEYSDIQVYEDVQPVMITNQLSAFKF